MSSSTEQPKRFIRTTVGEVTFKVMGRAARSETYLESDTLLQTLHTIKDMAPEGQTKIHLQHLINQIYELKPSL